MIAVDTSALVAVVLAESDAEALQSHPCLTSAFCVAEAGIVVEARQGPDASRDLRLLVEATMDEIAPLRQGPAPEPG